MNKIFDILIIGGGPAGMTAAIYGARAGKLVAICEKEYFGGQAATSPHIENYPGFDGSGLDLMNEFQNQIDKYENIIPLYNEVTAIEKKNNTYEVTLDCTTIVYSKVIIFATGLKRRKLGVKGEEELLENGKISYCVTCDGAFFRDLEVAVIGDGTTAIQYALELTKYCKKVSIVALFDRLFTDQYLTDFKKMENIKVYYNFKTVELQDVEDNGIIIKAADGREINAAGAFVAIGLEPQASAFKNIVAEDAKGFICVSENGVSTSMEGIFAAGDCRVNTVGKQVAMAVGDGAAAAIEAIKYLNRKE